MSMNTRKAIVLGGAAALVTLVAGTAFGSPSGAPPPDINWWWGLINTQEGLSEPNLLFRPEGMPAPVLAFVINAAILFGVIIWFGHKPIAHGIRARRERIMAGIQAAAKMKAEAEAQLAEHEAKLDAISDEIERLKEEMRENTETERKQALQEARERAQRMQREALYLIEQELKGARESLMHEAVRTAFAEAEDILQKQTSALDHQRIADEYVTGLGGAVQKAGRGGASA